MRTITSAEYRKLVRLLKKGKALRAEQDKVLAAACEITGDPDNDNGHTADAVMGNIDHTPDELLALLGISIRPFGRKSL